MQEPTRVREWLGPRLGRRPLCALLALAALWRPGAAGCQAVAQLVEVQDIAGLAASPDGTKIAFRTERPRLDEDSYVLEWHVAELGRREVRSVGGGGDPVYADPGAVRSEQAFWSADGRYLFYRALLNGRVLLWRAAADGSGGSTAYVADSNIEDISAEEEEHALQLRLGATRDAIARAEEREYDDGILVDASVDQAQPLFRGGFVDGRKASERLTGTWFRRGGLLRDRPLRTVRIDMTTLATSDVTRESATPNVPVPLALPALSARSSGGAVATLELDARGSRLWVRPPNSTRPIPCSAAVCRGGRIVTFAWRPGADELLLTADTTAHDQSLYLWQVGAAEARFLAGGNGLLSGGRNARSPCTVTAQSAICVAASPLSPPLLVAVDLASGAVRTLYDPNPELRGASALEAERLDWKDSGGRAFSGILFRRTGAVAAVPLVIDYYRCEGDVRGGVGDEFPFVPLAAAGIAALCINAPSIAGPQRAETTYRVALEGVRAIIGKLARRKVIDPGKVGMAGLSFGSEVAMWTEMKSDLLAAVSIASVQLEPGYYWLNGVRGRDQPHLLKEVWGLGAPDETPRSWRRLSPALNVPRLRAPVLMQLPEEEAREVTELYARLTNSATPAELYAFPDEDHIKILPRHKLAVYRRNLDWFRFWLQGYVDPDPSRSEQFRRWRQLAERQRASARDRSHNSVAASSMTRK